MSMHALRNGTFEKLNRRFGRRFEGNVRSLSIQKDMCIICIRLLSKNVKSQAVLKLTKQD